MLASLFDLEYCEDKSDSGSSTTGSVRDDERRAIVESLFRQADLNLKAKQVSPRKKVKKRKKGFLVLCFFFYCFLLL